MTITKAQTAKIKERAHEMYGDKVVVDFAMRYGNPSTKSKVREMVAKGCSKILFFPLYRIMQVRHPQRRTINSSEP